MSKKIKGVVLDPTTPYGVGLCMDDRARMKYQTLMQEYDELRKEVNMMRSRLESGKQRKVVLAAEVRFLRKRFGYLMKTETVNLSHGKKLVEPPNLHKQMKQTKEFSRRKANLGMLPPIPEVRPKKKQYISKEGTSRDSKRHRKMLDVSTTVSDLNRKGGVDTRENNSAWNTAPVLDLNKKERMHANDTAPRNTSIAFDLNHQCDSSSGKEPCLPNRAPIFDLNEISTGDEDFRSNEEGGKSLNELMVRARRNGGEGTSHVGKRKISWQDPVALRV